jgi:hypothetical protein
MKNWRDEGGNARFATELELGLAINLMQTQCIFAADNNEGNQLFVKRYKFDNHHDVW